MNEKKDEDVDHGFCKDQIDSNMFSDDATNQNNGNSTYIGTENISGISKRNIDKNAETRSGKERVDNIQNNYDGKKNSRTKISPAALKLWPNSTQVQVGGKFREVMLLSASSELMIIFFTVRPTILCI